MHRKIIKVFLGSPSDLEQERQSAKVIVDEENTNHANDLGYHIDLVGWEDTVSQRRRAQDAINFDLDQCEYFVGLLWKRWGTPPGPEGYPYTSGFEEEYRRSVERFEKSGKPEISLLFKNIPQEDLSDIGKQLEKVLEFQNEINDEKKQYYQKFQDLRDFEHKFRAVIAKFLKDQQLEDSKSSAHEPQQPRKKDESGNEQQSQEKQPQLFDSRAMDFIEEFVNKEHDGENAYSAAEAARFRLLACSISQSGNDNIQLGTHDANIIYRDLREEEFSAREYLEILSTALESLGSSTVPLWHWIFLPSYNIKSDLPLRTLWGEEKHRRSAFRLLEMLSISPKDFEGAFDSTDFRKFWFSKGVSDDLVIAALEYLGVVGDDDIQIDWDQFIGSPEANVSNAAVRSLVRLKSQISTTEALRFVAEHDSVDLGDSLAIEILSSISTIETEVLRACLKNKTRSFVFTIAKVLYERKALTIEDAHILCESSEADIRLFGAKAMMQQNPGLTFAEVRNILVKPKQSSSLGLLFSPQNRDYPGEEAFEDYKVDILCRKPYQYLIDMQKNESFFSNEATIALYRGHFRKVKVDLEKNLLDGFRGFCTDKVKAAGESVEAPSADVYNFVREGLIQSGLEAFCAGAGKTELASVRRAVDEYDVRFAVEIVEYFARFGDWEDVDRIVSLSGNMKIRLGVSLFSIFNDSTDYETAARAILKLGAKRIADVWKKELPNGVRVRIVVQMPKKLFSEFSDRDIIDMLLWKSEVVREVVALKSVLCLSKSRLRDILEAYFIVDGNYYYNAIFWIDLGISAEQKKSRELALRKISSK